MRVVTAWLDTIDPVLLVQFSHKEIDKYCDIIIGKAPRDAQHANDTMLDETGHISSSGSFESYCLDQLYVTFCNNNNPYFLEMVD